MLNQMQKDMKPPRDKWFVFTFVFWSAGISFNNFPLGDLVINDKKLILKPYFDFAYGSFQFTPQQISKIAASKLLYFLYTPLLLFWFAWILFVFFVVGGPIPSYFIAIAIIALILGTIPILFFKSFRIHHNIGAYPGHIYFFCLRRHASSIVDALTRCGFGDKLDQPHGSSQPIHTP
jgi:hypothetical protein